MTTSIIGLLDGKKGLITGIANNLSISWAIAKIAKIHSADMVFAYQGEVLKQRVMPLAEEVGCNMVYQCDVTNDDSMDRLFDSINKEWGKLDFIVHSIAFSDRNELKGRYIDTTLPNFLNTMNISCYSLTALQNVQNL